MLRTAVIGTGSMGANHVRIFNELTDLQYIVDTNKSRVKTLSKHYGVDYLLDYKELFDKGINNPRWIPLNIVEKINSI